MELKFKQIPSEHSDCNADYEVEVPDGTTISEFINAVLERNERGSICIISVGHIAYRNHKVINGIIGPDSNSYTISRVSANSRSNHMTYTVYLKNPDFLPAEEDNYIVEFPTSTWKDITSKGELCRHVVGAYYHGACMVGYHNVRVLTSTPNNFHTGYKEVRKFRGKSLIEAEEVYTERTWRAIVGVLEQIKQGDGVEKVRYTIK